jgi:hypothetical protein
MNTLSRNFDNNRLEVKPFVYTLDEKSEKIWDDYRIFLTKRHRETPNNNEKMMISKIEIYCLRLALILHIAENHSDLKNNLEVNYTTIYNSIKLSEILLELMKQTFDMATGERISNFGVPKKYVDFYKTLPHGEFKRNVAKEKCNNFGISERSCFDFLKNTVFFVKTAYGHYMKILDIE